MSTPDPDRPGGPGGTPEPVGEPEPVGTPEAASGVGPAPGPPAPQAREFRHRAAPKYRSFIASGVLLGALATAVLVRLRRDDSFSTEGIIGYLGSTLVILGAVLGAAVALLIERRQNRRSGRR